MRGLAVLLLCGTVLLGACRKASDPEPPTTSTSALPATTQPAPATTATTIDVSAPPTPAQLQDPAYWNAVLAALNHVAAEAIRSAVRTRAVEPSAVEALQQVYGREVLPGYLKALNEIAEGKYNGLIIPPGDPVAKTTKVLKSNETCVGLAAMLNYEAVNPTVPNSQIFVELRRSQLTIANGTPWIIEREFIVKDPDDMSLLCSG